MTEEKLSLKGPIASKRRIIGLVLAVLAIFVAALWLVRQPIAEAIARSVCEGQQLSCKIRITRLDFGGVTLTGFDARAREAPNPALSARELAVEFAWDNPFSLRPTAVSGDELVVRLDLTGRRSLLGDLEAAFTSFTKPTGKPPGPTPKLNFAKVVVIGDTLSGPVTASGTIKASGPDAFVIDLSAAPATLGLTSATVQLASGQIKATVAGAQISATARLDLTKFEATDTLISNVKIDATLEQTAGVLKGEGAATLGSIVMRDTTLNGAEARASLESAAVDPSAFDFSGWLAGLRTLQLDASAGEGALAGTTWAKAQLTASVLPQAAGGSAGEFVFGVDEVRFPQGAAGRVEIKGAVDITQKGMGTAKGDARIQAAVVSPQSRGAIENAISLPLNAALPAFGASAGKAIDRAALNFDISAPWTAQWSAKSIDAQLLTGAQLKAASGLSLTLLAISGKQVVASATSFAKGSWTAAGSLHLVGGGGPSISLAVARAEGASGKISLSGAAALKPWRVGADAISADFTGLAFEQDANAGKAAGQLTVSLDGALGGGVWKGAHGTGKVVAVWDRDTFAAEAPQGVVIAWREARYGDTIFGAAALHYAPSGSLAVRVGEGIVGRGSLATVALPVTGGAWSAKVSLGQTGINWRAANGFRANFDMAPSTIDMTLDQRKIPIRIDDVKGELDLRDGWRVTGAFTGGGARADEATIADLGGKFDLGGKGDTLDGSLNGVAMRILDPLDEAERRYEEAKFEGAATLRASLVDFTGQVTMVKTGVQVAHITGRHSLKDNQGSASYDPTPLIFSPGAFQPSALSPLLRGPANVVGRVDISGAASWSDQGLKASATADLRKIGFALASAGVFEGVSGKVEIADLLTMQSAPGQSITIDKVTLGLPIEKGVISFKLVGFDAVALEGAEWPFGGGFLRIKPMRFSFVGGETNRVVAQAVNWDLARLIEDFKVPDLKLKGVVGGDFPVMFTTGSAIIDNATLEATKDGGVIQYSGSTGDAAAQVDDKSKLVFDALKDFRYTVLKVGLNGDLAGRMTLLLSVLGQNPELLGGTPFQLNIAIDSALVQLMQSAAGAADVRTIINQVTGGEP